MPSADKGEHRHPVYPLKFVVADVYEVLSKCILDVDGFQLIELYESSKQEFLRDMYVVLSKCMLYRYLSRWI